MLLAQSVTVTEIPVWVAYVFAVALVVLLTWTVSWVLKHPTPE